MVDKISFQRFRLFNGDELETAAAMSLVAVTRSSVPRVPGFDTARRLFDDLVNARVSDLLPKRLIVSGVERDSGMPLSILYSGPLRTLDYCAGAIFASGDYDDQDAEDRAAADIAVGLRRLDGLAVSRAPSIRTPQWVRQVLDLEANWPETIAALPKKQRREIARMLRRHGYRAAMSSGPNAIAGFKTELLNPGLEDRFGRGAIVAADDRFVRQCRGMLRLDLTHEDTVVAANLLEMRGRRLAIRKCALKPGLDALRGRADVLDYYSLLTAQLLGCNTLDFGLSRPHLEDGSFRYKAKWGTRIVAADGLLKADVRITPIRYTAPVRAFLRRAFFLQRAERGFVVRVVHDADSSPVADWPLWRLADVDGIGHIDLLHERESPPYGIPPGWAHRVRARPFEFPAGRGEPREAVR